MTRALFAGGMGFFVASFLAATVDVQGIGPIFIAVGIVATTLLLIE